MSLFNMNRISTEDPRYNDSICSQRLCCKIQFAVTKKLDRTHLKHEYWILLNSFFYYKSYVLCSVRIALVRQF